MDRWFYYFNDSWRGPVDKSQIVEAIRQGIIEPSVTVRMEGSEMGLPAFTTPAFVDDIHSIICPSDEPNLQQKSPDSIKNSRFLNLEPIIRKKIAKPNGKLTEADIERVTELELDFSYGAVNAGRPVNDISSLANLMQLKKLTLRNHDLSDDQLRHLSRLTKLTHLELGNCSIADDQLHHLTGLTQLKTLRLEQNYLTDVSVLSGFTQLEVLSLIGLGLADVSPLSSLKQLEVLYLSYNLLTDLTPLYELKLLRILWLGNNSKLTKTEIKRLKKALPQKMFGLTTKCQIKHDVHLY